ncbi:hypothetical protein SAY86_016991 [Trapa natans]|uniref:Uncharacterized protein n=1 Tax=Trapa natans TaxID=22666 RepID=A0AAN7LPQ2_TRANT|nr:hypothetical protein SAY86_016991 [Trapa natans]
MTILREEGKKERGETMDVERIFHMTGGVGDTSYSKNSSLQKKASDMVKHITMEAVREVFLSLDKPRSFGMADLGCSSGPNTLSIIKDIIRSVEEAEAACSLEKNKLLDLQRPSVAAEELRVYLNDLPTNDFNSIFKALPDFHDELKKSSGSSDLYIAASPGSFYGRLFPSGSLHFVYSSYGLHWLSKVPEALYDEDGKSINKGCIYISESSPPTVALAYQTQFQEDFSSFLRFRSQELVRGGQMVLILLGRRGLNHVDRGNSLFWEILSRSFSKLIMEGEVEKEKLDSYEVHFFAPCKEEVESLIGREGSFEMTRFEMFELERDEGIRRDGYGYGYGGAIASTVRAVQESLIRHHFGDGINLDKLFECYAGIVDEEMAKEEIRAVTFLLVLRKLA